MTVRLLWLAILLTAALHHQACAWAQPTHHSDWIAKVERFKGRSKSDVVANIGEPTSKSYRNGLESWGYLGTYGSSKSVRNRIVYLIFSDDRLVSWEDDYDK